METQNLFRMYFGRNIGHGSTTVSGQDMETFIGTHIVPVFDGFTMYGGEGYWQGESEWCFIVEIITDNVLSKMRIGAICKAYKEIFNQESVLVTRQPVDMELI